MSLESLRKLAELTGINQDTIRNAAEDLGLQEQRRGQAILYESQLLLPYLYGITAVAANEAGGGQVVLDFNAEKTRLTIAQREKIELDMAVKSGDLVERRDVLEYCVNMIANCKMRLLSIPTKLAPEAALLDDPKAVKSLAHAMVTEALEELKVYD